MPRAVCGGPERLLSISLFVRVALPGKSAETAKLICHLSNSRRSIRVGSAGPAAIAEEARVESAVIGGLAALLGLILGRVWDRRSESSNWRRDQRTRCYEQLFTSYYELRDRLRLLGAAVPGTPESDDAIDRVLEVGARRQSNVAAVWLHSSEPVSKAAKEVDDQANALFMVARVEQLSWDQYRVRRTTAEGALEQLIAAIRHELGLPEFEVALRWRLESPSKADKPSVLESGNPEPLP
jgi:hypothetical protein